MELRTLGKTDCKVTPLALGTWVLGGWMWGGIDEKEAVDAIQTAFHAGITTIDTAPVYGFGKSEELIGKALEGIPREKYQILTKFGMNWQTEEGDYFFDTTDSSGKPVKIYRCASAKKIVEECEKSLHRLKIEYIDLYQIHWADSTTPISETFEAVQRLIEQGKVKAAGVCNYRAQQVQEAMNTIQLASNQVPYSMIDRAIEKEIIPQAIEKGVGILAYSPLQRGLLTGKMQPGYQFKEGDARKKNPLFTDENILKVTQLLDEIRPIAEKHKATLAELVINWTMRQPGITSVLVGARNRKQVLDNAGALRFTLSAEEIKKIREKAEGLAL